MTLKNGYDSRLPALLKLKPTSKTRDMPIYMDRHDVSDAVTAEIVAQLHQADLKIQHEFDCRGLTYWFDEKRKTAFCLVEAPNKQAIQEMHNHAHGEVSHMIIEVEANIVESFLGRIEDPEKALNSDLNIINDPAFRTIMVIKWTRKSLKTKDLIQSDLDIKRYNELIIETLSLFNGRLVKQQKDYFLVSFESVSNALSCALKLQVGFQSFTNNHNPLNIELKIALSAGLPVTGKDTLFEDTIKLAERMCETVKAAIIVSSETKELYESENYNTVLNSKQVFSLKPEDEIFLNRLINFVDKIWSEASIKVEDFNKPLGFSKSQLYRKLNALTGKSLNTFLKEYRLNRALNLLQLQAGNISEVAFDAGFSSPSYFSKCFRKKFGVYPSDYLSTIKS
jgi:AraC-like DNA-binding protein